MSADWAELCWTAVKLRVLVFVFRTIPKSKKINTSDYKDKNVFGVPLLLNVQRTNHPLPIGILQALDYLRSHFLDQVWPEDIPLSCHGMPGGISHAASTGTRICWC